jgi:uncharacterized damage-inducible protein DinB
MYYKIQDFLNDWEYESASTLKILNSLTDESLSAKVYPEGRTLAILGWHISNTIGEMMNRTGIKIKTCDESSDAPNSAKKIAEHYEKASKELVEELVNKWKDETLSEEDDMYGSTWKRGSTLVNLITHQIHHRGQMTVLMRQAGLKVPGIYGPSKEEWASMGMEPMK